MRDILLTPGPVPVPAKVLNTLALPVEHHRTPNFEATLHRVLQGLQNVFMTTQPVCLLTATGSGAMEAALVNTCSQGDEILCVVSGKFGERWAEMAQAYGVHVHRLEVPWGQSVTVEAVANELKKSPRIRAVFTQACETSTGAWHPIAELSAFLRPKDTLLVVDAITALGALAMPMDAWGIDVLVGGSQKAFMLPTGMSFIAFSEKAKPFVQTARLPRYYFDIRKELKANARGETFFSSNVCLIRALDVVLQQFQTAGLPAVHRRIEALAQATRAGAHELGLSVFPQIPSPSLSCLTVPSSVKASQVRQDLESRYRVTIMAGQDQLKDKVLRIGHMGAITDSDILETLACLARALGQDERTEAAQSAARPHLTSAPQVFQ